MNSDSSKPPLDRVRDALHKAGEGMSPAQWKELLEELGADIDGHLDALREEAENEAD
jgi:hypothetical protein